MFDPWCPTCERRVLLGTRRIVSLHRDADDRLRLELRCFCGTVVASAAAKATGTELAASTAPAGLDATPPRPAEDTSPLAAADLAATRVA
jgi:hypothetical protein